MKKADNIILGAGGAIVAIVAAVASGAAAISFAAAAVAVCLPQTMMLFFARRCPAPADSAFSLAAGKFSCTILFLAVAARLLTSGEIFAAPFFVAGAAAALMFNVFNIARLARQTEAA